MDPQSLAQLEQMAEQLYLSANAEERKQAEAALLPFSMSVDYLPQCQYILDNSSQPYALLLASSSVLKLLTEHSNNFSHAQRMDIRNYVLGMLANKGPSIPHFVLQSLLQVVTRITKLSWFEDTIGHNLILDESMKFLGATSRHCLVGLYLLNQLCMDMNTHLSGFLLSQHRKIAVNFRDTCLLRIFQVSLSTLRQLLAHQIQVENEDQEEKLKLEALHLAMKCLSFDFLGNSQDESGEDLNTIQVPLSWRKTIEAPDTIQLFFEIFRTSRLATGAVALECLGYLASVRRSLFTNEDEKQRYLEHLMTCSITILRTKRGLDHEESYHSFCRLLHRLKGNYQLSDLIQTEGYVEWIGLVAEFTVNSFKLWQFAANSIYYLLGLWSKLVTTIPMLKGGAPSLLDRYVLEITKAYINSRMESVLASANDGSIDDPLEDEDTLAEQLQVLPVLCRFEYNEVGNYIVSMYNSLITKFQAISQTILSGHMINNESDFKSIEGQLTWIVYIISTIIGGRTYTTGDAPEVVDGDLSVLIFRLMAMIEQYGDRWPKLADARIERAIIRFFEQFRVHYVGDTSLNVSRVYSRLEEGFGIKDHLQVLELIVNKITLNLRMWPEEEIVIVKSLDLLNNLTIGHGSAKLLLKLDMINLLMSHHTSEHFPFLDIPTNYRHRNKYYTILSRLFFMEDYTAEKFEQYVSPLKQVFANIHNQVQVNPASIRDPQVERALIGVFRDLRGVTYSCAQRRPYGFLFDCIYPDCFPIIVQAAGAYADRPHVAIPLLRFMSEFLMNRSSRLLFDPSSPNGILLFREASKVLVEYGRQVLAMPATNHGDIYQGRYKGMMLCMEILSRAMSGNYVNFGVFALYGDKALADAMDVTVKMASSIPLTELMSFPKLYRAYFQLIEVLFRNHTAAIVEMESEIFVRLVSSVEEGLKSMDSQAISNCASALDCLAAYYFYNATKDTPGGRCIAAHVSSNPQMFPRFMHLILNCIMFEDAAHQWCLSRPLLSLILINKEYFEEIQQQLAVQQGPERQGRLQQAFEKLMQGIKWNLETRNRDRFAQNLTTFRYDVKSFIV